MDLTILGMFMTLYLNRTISKFVA